MGSLGVTLSEQIEQVRKLIFILSAAKFLEFMEIYGNLELTAPSVYKGPEG